MSARRAAAAALLLLAACPAPRATLRPPARLPVELAPDPLHDEFALAGVVHVVRPGETIWRIARAYGIDAADLMETNGLADPRALAARRASRRSPRRRRVVIRRAPKACWMRCAVS